jgi:hypothetical protein
METLDIEKEPRVRWAYPLLAGSCNTTAKSSIRLILIGKGSFNFKVYLRHTALNE